MKVYMDHAATTPISPAALAAMTEVMSAFPGNPSSLYSLGREANKKLEEARAAVANAIHAQPREIIFTSGGTESDNAALRSMAARGARKGKKHLISSAFEHHAVLHTLEQLKKEGFEITLLPVHEDGLVRPEELEGAIREDTAGVSIMFANNEVGTVQPIAELGAVCRAHGVPFHTDAVQAVGHLPIDVEAMKIDLLSMSAHKFHGPRGIGALYIRSGTVFEPFMLGGAQERGKRAGTENTAAAVGMAVALTEATERMEEENERVRQMRDRLIDGVLAIPHARLNGDRYARLAGNASFCFEGIEGEALLLRLDLQGVSASSGSACTSGSLDPSHVLLALGLPHEIAHGSLRLSLSGQNTEEEIDHVLAVLPKIVETLREMSPVWERMMNDGLHG